jgi:RND family efflux transporter MFP subunit
MRESKSWGRRLVGVLLPFVLIGAAVGVFVLLMKTRPKPPKKPTQEAAALVDVMRVDFAATGAVVEAMGTVEPAREVRLQPEVSGLVVWVAPGLEPGARLEQGDVLLRVDPRNYEAVVAQQEASVARAELELELERSRGAVAAAEWDLVAPEERDAALRELALREPQFRAAAATLDAARAQLDRARWDLERTEVRCPFPSLVRTESVEVGQWVGPQSAVAQLVGMDRFWVRASLPAHELAWFPLPDARGEGGAAVRVRLDAGAERSREWAGRVIRLLPDLDPAGRMARVLVEVLEPRERDDGLPLLIGAYVRARIQGHAMENVAILPSDAVHEGDRVWVVGSDARLDVRQVDVVRRESSKVVVSSGVAAGDRIVTSRIPVPIPGMKLRVRENESRNDAAAEAGP